MRRILIVAAVVSLAGCAGQPFTHGGDALPGFWWGALHGVIAPFSLIGSFFDSSIRAYAFPNSGWWYDFGYVMGLGILMGGGAAR